MPALKGGVNIYSGTRSGGKAGRGLLRGLVGWEGSKIYGIIYNYFNYPKFWSKIKTETQREILPLLCVKAPVMGHRKTGDRKWTGDGRGSAGGAVESTFEGGG